MQMKYILPLCLLAMLLLVACASTAPAPKNTPVLVNADQAIVKAGQRFTIEIPGNITTGYVWRPLKGADGQSYVEFLGEDYQTEKSKEPLCGAPGKHCFSYQALEPGECILRFEHLRPWEEAENAPRNTREYHITVR